MISIAQVTLAMQPWLGMALLNAAPLAEKVALKLNAYRPTDDPDALCRALDSLLFGAIRQIAGPDMRVLLDDGTWIRVRTEDVATMTDDVMFLYFETYPVDPPHRVLLNDYALSHHSLSALRALYTRFQSLHTREELSAIARIARGGYPAFRLGWLNSSQTRS